MNAKIQQSRTYTTPKTVMIRKLHIENLIYSRKDKREADQTYSK
jgi:hypothetical protein